MSITGAEIRLCSFDDKPINESEIYNGIKSLHGEDIANQFTYDYCVNFGSSELQEAMFIVTGGQPPGIYKKEREIS